MHSATALATVATEPEIEMPTQPDKKIAFILGPMFEDSEFRVPYDRIREAGYAIEVIGAKAGEVLKGDKGKEHVTTDRSIDDVQAGDYLALVIPGGGSPDKLRGDQRFVQFVKDFDAQQRPLAAICHGPQLLEAAHLVQGRTLTAWKTIQDDLSQMGAVVKDQAVVKDRNWITSRKPDDEQQFSDAILKALESASARPEQPRR